MNRFEDDPSGVVTHFPGNDATVISYGTILNQAAVACRMLKGNGNSDDVDVSLFHLYL